ncbi:MAG: CheR family methyltransferase [Candidatus Sumerlaeia bacterium]
MNNTVIGGFELSDNLYRKFVKLVYDAAGISLGEAKRELVRSRLSKRLRTLGLASFEQYYQFLSKNDPEGNELVMMLDCISTNKTDFFREGQHFIFLRETILPTLMNKARHQGNKCIRIWSAGCSSGEEPYTLAMVLRDSLDPSVNWDCKILATDISTKVLHFAYEGIYEEQKAQAIPPQFRSAYFTREKTAKGTVVYRVKPEIRQMVTFRRLNLMNATFPFSGTFHIIFCRNVMIYFDKQTQEALVNRFYRYLSPGGYLFIGHSESLNSLKTPFQFVKPTIYLRNN